jgi:hypothetical protein
MSKETTNPYASPVSGGSPSDLAASERKAGTAPPPDHEGFVEARSHGLQAVRANLARRKKLR